jgi:photosystem II stability/assembly factor-like uncharacterized protein
VKFALTATHRAIRLGGYVNPPTFFTAPDGVVQAGIGTASGTHDSIYTTTDGGITWTVHRPPSPTAGAMDVLSPTAWFIANRRTLYVTTNAGTRWTPVRWSIPLSRNGSNTLDLVSPTVGWTVAAGGKQWHTTDGGRTWERSPISA